MVIGVIGKGHRDLKPGCIVVGALQPWRSRAFGGAIDRVATSGFDVPDRDGRKGIQHGNHRDHPDGACG